MAHISRASWTPRLPVQTLAHPELVTQARRTPPRMWSRPTMMGAPTTLLRVKTAAALAGTSDTRSARSGLPEALIPQCIAAARKPETEVIVALAMEFSPLAEMPGGE